MAPNVKVWRQSVKWQRKRGEKSFCAPSRESNRRPLAYDTRMVPQDHCQCRQTWCRIDGQPPDWILSTKVSSQLLWKRRNTNPSFLATAITWIEMFIAQTEIFFWMQSPCRIDGRTLNWILSRKVVLQLSWKRLNSYPSFSTSSITRSEMFIPKTKKIFGRQSCFRIDGQPPDWILSTKVSSQLLWKRINSNPSFFRNCYYLERDVYSPDWNIFPNAISM
jgi:hypothetical protein